MADADAVAAELGDLRIVEIDAMRQPGAVGEPAAILEIVHRRHAVLVAGEVGLLLRLDEVGMQAAIVLFGKRRRLAHQPLGDVERRVGGERDAGHRPVGKVVVAADDALAIGEDDVVVLDGAAGGERLAVLGAGEIERAARQRHAQADPRCLLRLDVHRVLEAAGKEIVVVGGAGAARHQQFGHGQAGGEAEILRVHVFRPIGIDRGDPRPERLVDRRWMRPRHRLEEVVMRVDEARRDDMARGVEDLLHGMDGLGAAADAFDDPAAFHDDAALGAFGEDGDGVADPDAFGHGGLPIPFPPGGRGWG